MSIDQDIVLVEKAVVKGFRDQDSCNAWERIKTFLNKKHCVYCNVAEDNLDLIERMDAVKKDLEKYKHMYEGLCK
jgi:adenosylmethionine-8-amino-7-oxononanoate aminotransferase